MTNERMDSLVLLDLAWVIDPTAVDRSGPRRLRARLVGTVNIDSETLWGEVGPYCHHLWETN